MKLFNIKEAVARVIFWVVNIRYFSKRHYLVTVFLMIFIMLIIFTSVFISQRQQLERNENIIRSFYGDPDPGKSKDPVLSDIGEKLLIKVHVCGEVAVPGVYEVEKGSRVIDLIKIAGGGTEEACLDSHNLAQEAFDGQKIYVPSQEEVVLGNTDGTCISEPGIHGDGGYIPVININTASSSQLESLPGIGPVTAGKIIQYRERYGTFESIEDLMDISGIGPKKFEQIKDLIDV
jgi:competence protein ComEA